MSTSLRPPDVPHDPPRVDGEYTDTCGICGTTWPCPERTRQRREARAITDYLRSDLYEVQPWEPEHAGGRLWASPIGWRVWIGYGEHGLVVLVDDYMHGAKPGEPGPWVGSNDATVHWIDEVLP